MEVGRFSERKKSKTRLSCAVNGCQSKSSKDLDLIFHKCPKPGDNTVNIENFFGNVEKIDKYQAWINVLKIKKVTPTMKICSLHFKKSDYILPNVVSQKRFLKKNVVPSCNLPKRFGVTNNVKNEARLQRKLKRDDRKILTGKTKIQSDKSVIKMNELVIETPVIEVLNINKMEDISIKKEYEYEDNEEMNYKFAFVNVTENEIGTFQQTNNIKVEDISIKLEPTEPQNKLNVDIHLANVSNVSIHNIKSEIDIEEYSQIPSNSLVKSEPITDLEQGINQETIEIKSVQVEKVFIKTEYEDLNNIDLGSANILQESVDKTKNKIDIEEHLLVPCKYEDGFMKFESIEVSENCINQERAEKNINREKGGVTCNEISNTLENHEKKYGCDICHSKLANKRSFTAHMRNHAKVKSFQCKECNKGFIRIADLNRHMLVHTGEKPFSCEICNKTFSVKNNFATHMRTHTGEKNSECNICHKRFTQSSNLICHMRTHTGERKFECKICNKKFTHSSTLKVHMRTHTGERSFECSICNKTFTMSSTLTAHIRIHTGEKKFICSVCNSKFTHSSTLNIHMRTHTGEKKFECDICNSKFTHSHTLKNHKRTHSGEKKIQCNLCDKKFLLPYNLKVHLRTHTGERNYQCYICNTKFVQASHLTSHIRTHTVEGNQK